MVYDNTAETGCGKIHFGNYKNNNCAHAHAPRVPYNGMHSKNVVKGKTPRSYTYIIILWSFNIIIRTKKKKKRSPSA